MDGTLVLDRATKWVCEKFAQNVAKSFFA
jgi:hypothetical protein